MSRGPWATINLNSLQHNFSRVKSYAPRSSVIAMVKSGAYGHGAVRVAKGLQQADAFGVASLEEAVLLRQANIAQPIILLAGFFTHDELDIIVQQQLDIVVHNEEQIRQLELAKLPNPVNVWLKIDTGMHRLGIHVDDVKQVYQRLFDCSSVAKPLRLMSHLADADDPSKKTTSQQITLFNKVTNDYSCSLTMANSGGIIAWPKSHYDWVRPGLMLYGVSPILNATAADYDLQPVMTLQSQIMAIHQLAAGDCVGYGGAYQVTESMPVGVVAIGYGDGYPRHAVNGTPVLINNIECPIIGRVSMDMITVDLRPCANVNIGDSVVLWGNGLPIERIAEHSSTIAYELLCSVGRRVTFSEA